MELGKRRVESVEVGSVPEEKVLTLEEEPVLTLSLRFPALEGTHRRCGGLVAVLPGRPRSGGHGGRVRCTLQPAPP